MLFSRKPKEKVIAGIGLNGKIIYEGDTVCIAAKGGFYGCAGIVEKGFARPVGFKSYAIPLGNCVAPETNPHANNKSHSQLLQEDDTKDVMGM